MARSRPGLGKTRHKWLITDLDGELSRSQAIISRMVTETRKQQEKPGRPSLQELAMMMAELAQIVSQSRNHVVEMRDLVEAAPGKLDNEEQLRLLIADLQRQVDELRGKLCPE